MDSVIQETVYHIISTACFGIVIVVEMNRIYRTDDTYAYDDDVSEIGKRCDSIIVYEAMIPRY